MSTPNRTTELSKAGWARRTIMDEPRLTELIGAYKDLELEVHLEPLTPVILQELGEECKACYIDHWDNYKIIFTREQK
jgi:hypothetical protein